MKCITEVPTYSTRSTEHNKLFVMVIIVAGSSFFQQCCYLIRACVKSCAQTVCICGTVEEGESEEIGVVKDRRSVEDQCIKSEQERVRMERIAESKHIREKGLKTYSAEESEARLADRVLEQKSLSKKIKKAIVNTVDDTNSLIFNQITD